MFFFESFGCFTWGISDDLLIDDGICPGGSIRPWGSVSELWQWGGIVTTGYSGNCYPRSSGLAI